MENKIKSLLHWLHESGQFVLAHNVCVTESDGSGRGVILVDGILKKNEIVASVPSSHQLNFHTVLYHLSKFNYKVRVPNVTVDSHEDDSEPAEDPRYRAYNVLDQSFLLSLSSFQLLSLYVLAEWCLLPIWSQGQTKSFWEPFFNVWPTQAELKSFPAIWHCSKISRYENLLELLPAASKYHLVRISALIENDWRTISPIINKWNALFNKDNCLPTINEQFEKFLHIYCIINSRCLYTEVPLKEGDATSNFTMVPFVDFLNHTQDVDVHCYPQKDLLSKVSHGLGQFTIRCGNHTYNVAGEAILLNYGAHSNDFLLNEYGFVMKENKWNFIDISQEVCSMVKDEATRQFLKDNGYWGDYTVDSTTISYRVLVAISLIVTGDYKRVEKLLKGYISEDYFSPMISKSLCDLLTCLKMKFEKIILILEKENDFCSQNVLRIHQDYVEIIEQNLSRI